MFSNTIATKLKFSAPAMNQIVPAFKIFWKEFSEPRAQEMFMKIESGESLFWYL